MNIRRATPHALPLPSYAHPGDAGLDLAACIDGVPLTGAHYAHPNRGATLRLYPGGRVAVPCGFAFAIPTGHVGLVLPRSSAFRAGYTVRTGVIDSGFRGEIAIGVECAGSEPVDLTHGDRVAQLVVVPCVALACDEVAELDATSRGASGFGSTGR